MHRMVLLFLFLEFVSDRRCPVDEAQAIRASFVALESGFVPELYPHAFQVAVIFSLKFLSSLTNVPNDRCGWG
jgi:hypothetical protein